MTKNTSKCGATSNNNNASATHKPKKTITVKLIPGQGSYIPWAGAKSWSYEVLHKRIPAGAKRLVFACAGAGSDAVAYAALGLPMVLADLNPDLICAHQFVQKNPANAITALVTLFTAENNTKARYYELRAEFNRTPKNTPRRAALFIYLLWHCMSGICRYNGKGEFNNGFGARHEAKQAVAVPADAIRRFAAAMAKTTFVHQSLLVTLSNAKSGDVVIIDPPYSPAQGKNNCHTGYTANGFGIKDHQTMVAAAKKATAKGVVVITHDHLTKATRQIHQTATAIQPVKVPRRVANNQAAVMEGVFIYEAAPVSHFNAHGVLTKADATVAYKSPKDKSTAEIQMAEINGQWIAEYRFRFLCGDYAGSTLPLSVHSVPMATKEAAQADAARRLLADIEAKCPAPDELNKVQQAELVLLKAWVRSLMPAPAPQPPLPLTGKKFIDLFAGIGGFHQALKQQGATCVAACERDKAAQETYLRNYGTGYPMFDDVRDIDTKELPEFDILCGGFPCQSFSMAGDREGFAAADKGPLFFEIVRIAAARKPALLILENVEAFANHDKGRTATLAMDALAEIGYAASMKVLDASQFGVPQQRMRVFIVAHRIDLFRPQGNPFGFPVGTDPSKVVADILEEGITDGQCEAEMTPLPAKAKDSGPIVIGLINGKNAQGYRVMSPAGKGVTLCANSGGYGGKTGLYEIDGKPRRLTPRECARMQGFPESFIPHSSITQACKQFGNSVAVPVVSAVAEAAAKFF